LIDTPGGLAWEQNFLQVLQDHTAGDPRAKSFDRH